MTPPPIILHPVPKWTGVPCSNSRIHLLLGGVRGHATVRSWKEATREGWLQEMPSDFAATAARLPEGYGVVLQTRGTPARLVILGNTVRSIQYGKVSADQLLRSNPRKKLPEVVLILDWPDLPTRCACWPGKGDIELFLRRMVDRKQNVLTLIADWSDHCAGLIDAHGRPKPSIARLIKRATALNLGLDIELRGSSNDGGWTERSGFSGDGPADPHPLLRKLYRAFPEVRHYKIYTTRDDHSP